MCYYDFKLERSYMNNFNFIDINSYKTIVYKDFEAIQKIIDMGLSYDILCQTFIDAIEQKRNLPPYAMSMRKNLTILFSAVETFRAQLLCNGWTYKEEKNFNFTISPNERIAVHIASGNEFVGRENSCKTQKKGKVSQTIIEMNKFVQLNLSIPNFYKFQIQNNRKNSLTWFLLFHRKGNRVQIELSLPRFYDTKAQKVIAWYERILLPDIIIPDDNITSHNSTDIPPYKGSEFQPLCNNSIDDIDITKK